MKGRKHRAIVDDDTFHRFQELKNHEDKLREDDKQKKKNQDSQKTKEYLDYQIQEKQRLQRMQKEFDFDFAEKLLQKNARLEGTSLIIP